MAIVVFLLATLVAYVCGEYEGLILNVHNDYRRDIGASDMNKLVWDNNLSSKASEWVNRCQFGHQLEGPYGENLFATKGKNITKNIIKGVKAWHKENRTYTYNRESCNTSCHFTQVVWSKTTKIGCSMHVCDVLKLKIPGLKKSYSNAWFFGCWYSPRANVYGQYPYDLDGEVCSKCATGRMCEDGLCAAISFQAKQSHHHVSQKAIRTILQKLVSDYLDLFTDDFPEPNHSVPVPEEQGVQAADETNQAADETNPAADETNQAADETNQAADETNQEPQTTAKPQKKRRKGSGRRRNRKRGRQGTNNSQQ